MTPKKIANCIIETFDIKPIVNVTLTNHEAVDLSKSYLAALSVIEAARKLLITNPPEKIAWGKDLVNALKAFDATQEDK